MVLHLQGRRSRAGYWLQSFAIIFDSIPVSQTPAFHCFSSRPELG
jgi:hypothetical protein